MPTFHQEFFLPYKFDILFTFESLSTGKLDANMHLSTPNIEINSKITSLTTFSFDSSPNQPLITHSGNESFTNTCFNYMYTNRDNSKHRAIIIRTFIPLPSPAFHAAKSPSYFHLLRIEFVGNWNTKQCALISPYLPPSFCPKCGMPIWLIATGTDGCRENSSAAACWSGECQNWVSHKRSKEKQPSIGVDCIAGQRKAFLQPKPQDLFSRQQAIPIHLGLSKHNQQTKKPKEYFVHEVVFRNLRPGWFVI